MSNFPNAVYIPTGIAGGEEFIKISGFCYKRVATGVAAAGEIRTNFVDGFTGCLDCNTCNCPKTIDFIMGGIEHNKSANEFNFVEKTYSIPTSSTGWQEIAIESGNLHNNDSNLQFKPLSIRCYDRKIDIQSGIYASFDDENAHIAHFQYASGSDIYERKDLKDALATGEFGDIPPWDFINQYDNAVTYQDTLRSIKFKSLCEVPCNKYDVSFRLRGDVSESSQEYLAANNQPSWVYLHATGVPRTPGQIVRYPLNFNFNDYFNVERGNPTIFFTSNEIELVNMDLLTGNTSNTGAQVFSVTGGRHYYETENGTYGGRPRELDGTYDFYLIDTDGDLYGVQQEYIDLGIQGVDYNKIGQCHSSSLSDFFEVYGIGENQTTGACLKTSEHIDGKYKIGTYRPMLFTGTLTGNAYDFENVFDAANVDGVTSWSSGVYVFQMYPSGDDSLLSNISGNVGWIHEASPELINEYKRQIVNSMPINIDNSIKHWNHKSGIFPRPDAELVEGAVFLETDTSQQYFQWYQSSMRHTNNEGETITPLYASGFRFGAGLYQMYYGLLEDGSVPDSEYDYVGIGAVTPPLLEMEPLTLGHTFVDYTKIEPRYLLVDSGDSRHNQNSPDFEESKMNDPVTDTFQEIQYITFQIPFKL